MEARVSWLRVAWVPRQRNNEADARTNGCFVGFNPELRIAMDVKAIKWKVMGVMLEAGGGTVHKQDRLHQGVKAPRHHMKEAVSKRRKVMAGGPRIRDPWQWRPGLACGLLVGGPSVRVAWAMVGDSGFLVTGVLQSPAGWGILDCISNSVLIGFGHFPREKKGFCQY